MASGDIEEVPVQDICDICLQREKHVTKECVCADCNLGLCAECRFTHSKIPACQNHKVQAEGSPVDNIISQSGDIVEDSGGDADAGYPQFVLQRDFSTVSGEDEVPPDIRAVFMLESGVILATDWGNCAIKSFDISGHFLGDYFFARSGEDAGRIHGITGKDPHTVYVTLPSFKKIATITVKHMETQVRFSPILHATRRRYFGIAHLERTKQLIVGTTDTLEVLSYNCRLLSVIRNREFANPYNMGIESPSSVIVADTKSNCLFRINTQQEVEKIEVGDGYRQLRGVTVDQQGNIFFASLKTDGVGWIQGGEVMGTLLHNEVLEVVGLHYKETRSGRYLVTSQKDGHIKLFNVK